MDEHVYEKPALTSDAVVIHRAPSGREVLLIRRGQEPFAGAWALPGGFVEPFERPEDAARRELAEETGLVLTSTLALVGVYGARGRDPRGWTVSAAYVAMVGGDAPEVLGGDDAQDARWFSVDALPELAFDHAQVVADALLMLG